MRSTVRLVFCAFLALSLRSVSGLECYRCVSTNSSRPFLCNEFLTDSEAIEPDSCDDVYGAKYCIKHVGRFEGGIGTKRFCSSVDLGNYCEYVQQPGDKLEYRTCVYTCGSDGCNPGTSISASKLIIVLLSALPSITYLLLR
uniref:Protein sleepless n=1 Tax=Trichogramma kaykai TaxID=54128 RepID=A0ABD2WUY2_9HYME